MLVGTAAPDPVRAADPPSAEVARFFESSVRPVLAEQCYKCHGPGKQSGGLRLDSRAAILEGGDGGPAAVPGEPDKSPLVLAARHEGELQMPPKGKIPDAQAAALAEWVRMGAPWPDTSAAPAVAPADAGRTHWAYQPVADPKPPAVAHADRVATPVDAFLLAKLEAKGLDYAPMADRPTLIRRASYDLIGLPPTSDEVLAFVADARSDRDAFAGVVDRLLASPRYGERWGRHWLDVARYADTKGYVFTQEKRYPYSYTYRDYVIAAFNDDKPFDRFVLEQIAADRLPRDGDNRPLAAMGFLTVGRRFLMNSEDIIDDRIDVVSRGFLGLSVACARCHDHKFDPIPTEDYYSLHGVFASSSEPADLPVLPDGVPPEAKADYERQHAERVEAVARHRAYLKALLDHEFRRDLANYIGAAFDLDFERRSGRHDQVARAHKVQPERLRFAVERLARVFAKSGEFDPVLTPWREFAALPADQFAAKAPELARRFASPPSDADRAIDPAVARIFAGDPPRDLAEVAARYGSLFAEAARSLGPTPAVGPPLPNEPNLDAVRARIDGDRSPVAVPADGIRQVLTRAEREKLEQVEKRVGELDATHPGTPARAMVMIDNDRPTNPHVYIRGNPGRPGKSVPRRFLRALSPGGEAQPFKEGSGRLELARAIASPDNPLTARVLVNRVWHDHFGVGLVATPSDFGVRGEPPTHPELLDYLARRFVRDGWSIKHLHRLIVLSTAYRQRSDRRDDGQAADPANQLLWRQNRRRLDFEAMRDGILAATGQLDGAMGGRPIELFDGKNLARRRTVYGYVDRYDLDATYRTFDYPSPDFSAPLRPTTTVPQQALFFLNSPFLLAQAKALARRVDLPPADQPEARIDRLYRDLYGRSPEAAEVAAGRQFVESRPAAEDDKAPTPWDEDAQVLLLTNEFLFID